MSTRSLILDQAMRGLGTQYEAPGRPGCRYRGLCGRDLPAHRPQPAAAQARHLPRCRPECRGRSSRAAGLAATFCKRGGRYELGSAKEKIWRIFCHTPAKPTPTRCRNLKHHPDAVFVFQDIDKAQPSLLKELMTAWSQGFITDEEGEKSRWPMPSSS